MVASVGDNNVSLCVDCDPFWSRELAVAASRATEVAHKRPVTAKDMQRMHAMVRDNKLVVRCHANEAKVIEGTKHEQMRSVSAEYAYAVVARVNHNVLAGGADGNAARVVQHSVTDAADKSTVVFEQLEAMVGKIRYGDAPVSSDSNTIWTNELVVSAPERCKCTHKGQIGAENLNAIVVTVSDDESADQLSNSIRENELLPAAAIRPHRAQQSPGLRANNTWAE